jgi:membrane-bound serine protease (ClpP class)
MKLLELGVVAAFGWLLLGAALGQNGPGGGREEPGGPEKLLRYPIRGVLDQAQVEKLRAEIGRRLQEWPETHSIVLELSSAGSHNGEIAPALQACEFLGGLKGVRVIAWVKSDQVAGNASALLALSAQDLVMSPGAQLGFWPDERAGQRVEVEDKDEKSAHEARAVFERAALNHRGLLGRSHLAAAMVSRFHPAIFKVKFQKVLGQQMDYEYRFLTQEEVANLPPADKQQKLGDDIAVPQGQRLTLDLAKATDWGFAVPVAGDDLSELLRKLNLRLGPEDIIDHEMGDVLKPLSPEAQSLVDFLTHPVVRFLLILGGTLGLLLEVKMPGTLIPSLTSLVCFAVFLVSGLFRPTGAAAPPTSLNEILLFIIGMGLMAVELLLLPGVMIFGLSGAAVCLISLVLAMVPPSASAGAAALNYKEALTLLITSAGTSAFIFVLLLRFLPHSRFLDRSGIVIHSSIQGTPTADSAIEAQTRVGALMGRVGLALTPLRPSGTMEVDGERVDVVAEGDFVEKGEKVQIIEADGTRTIVRRL